MEKDPPPPAASSVSSVLQNSELHYRRLFEASEDGILVFDPASAQVLDANESALAVFGESRADLVGSDLGKSRRFGEPGLYESLVAALAASGSVRRDNVQVISANGREFAVDLLANQYFVGAERVVQCRLRDVTERRHLEEKLQQAQKMEAMSQLAGGVSHGYNNILTAILLELGLLLDDATISESLRGSLQHIESEANRAADLTRHLMTFSRRQVIHRAPVDLNAVLDVQVKTLQRLMGKRINIEFHSASQPLWIEADVRMVEQVVTNLYVNAWDAMMPNGGTLTIEAKQIELDEMTAKADPESRPGVFACLTVADTGRGMDANTLKHSFDPFFTTKEVGKAAGLGLSIVYGIAKQHEGWVEVSSKLSRGSVFRVYFPVLARRPEPPAEAIPGIAPRGQETILVVEDEAAVRGMVVLGLQLYGYRVLGAGNAEEALEVWTHHAGEIDLLFADMRMPGMTGMELFDRLRRERPGLKVIISSGHSEEVLRAERKAAPGMIFLPKPYGMATLGTTVRRCLDGT